MRDQGYINDLLVLGRFEQLQQPVESLLSFDGLIQCFHYITENDRDLHRAAEMLTAVVKSEIYTLDQAVTLLSLAKMCCMAAGITGELSERIQNRLDILAQNLGIQKRAQIGDDKILATDELIRVFLAQKTVAIALCIYACSLEDRSEAENAHLFVDIMAELVSFGTDYNGFRQILVEARAVVRLPHGWDGLVENRFGDTATRAFVTRAVLEAFDLLSSA
jgi:hypothetical protein